MRKILIKLLIPLIGMIFVSCGEVDSVNPAIEDSDNLPQVSQVKNSRSINQSEIDLIKNNVHTLSWAYYQEGITADRANARWYISSYYYKDHLGKVLSLMPIENGNAGWGLVSNTAGNMNIYNDKITVGYIPDKTSCYYDDEVLGKDKYNCQIKKDVELIRDSTVDLVWWFFKAPNDGWYIVRENYTKVLKFASTNGQYDWNHVVEIGIKPTIYVENGVKKLKFDSSNTNTIEEPTYNGDWNVPYLSQRSTSYSSTYREAACGPTSLAMLVKFYYPNSHIDMTEIYHAGLQNFSYYNSGIDNYARNYLAQYVGMNHYKADINYLQYIWGFGTQQTTNSYDTSINEIYQWIENGPLLVYVTLGGDPSLGHFIVLRGINTNDTDTRDDDLIYINDPWNGGPGGEDREFSYNTFFGSNTYSGWYRTPSNGINPYALSLTPQDTALQREYTVVVDNGNIMGYDNLDKGNPLFNVFQLDDPNSNEWRYYYGNGEGAWHYPTTSGHIARWTPKLEQSGYYQVSTKFMADNYSNTIKYVVYDKDGEQKEYKIVNQYSSSSKLSYAIISDSVYLENGAYVRAEEISANTNVDAIKFKFLHQ